MVLQPQADVRLWGEAAPDSNVQIIPSWDKNRQTVTAVAVDEILDSDYPQLRLFRVKRDYSLVLLQDCRGEWAVSAPQSAETFSAVGFLFGRMLHQRLKVPVGMITCAWGGSKVEA